MVLESFGLIILIMGISGFATWFVCRGLPKKILLLTGVFSIIDVQTTLIILLELNLILSGYLIWTIGGGAGFSLLIAADNGHA